MPLSWTAENIKYFNDHPDELWTKYHDGTVEEYEDLNIETKSLVFSMPALGIGNISYKNAPIFYARYKIMEKYDNWYLYSVYTGEEVEKKYITPQVVIKHINLAVNVVYEETPKWLRRISNSFMREKRRPDLEKPTYKEMKSIFDAEIRNFESGL